MAGWQSCPGQKFSKGGKPIHRFTIQGLGWWGGTLNHAIVSCKWQQPLVLWEDLLEAPVHTRFAARAGARFATAPAGRNTSRTDQINLAGAAADSQPAGAARAVCRPQPELHESCAVNRYRFHDIRHAQTLPRAAATLVTPVPLLMSSLQLWQC